MQGRCHHSQQKVSAQSTREAISGDVLGMMVRHPIKIEVGGFKLNCFD